ncbi:hypothetical protein HMPREF1884_01224 [Streptococcus agalactiae]|nr:conserved hypothetical protein [Streptococcus agalactiae COH1]KXA54103.1 hypothetical protein HMPREF1884_01224 [Streptococcus agalactiae]CDN66777.1 conserved hypothetical protein [Streptococcus agalactiae COH1]
MLGLMKSILHLRLLLKIKKLLELLEEVNTLFHELFLTIECSFHYIGHDFPEKRAKITQIYHVIIEHLSIHYPEYDIKIESLLMG